MADITSDVGLALADTLSKYSSLLLIMSVLLVLLLVVYVIISKKYPRITFEVIEGKHKVYIHKRLMGDKIVPDNLIQILLEGHRILGFSINEFDYTYFGKERVYLATRRGNDLIPLRIVDDEIKLEELGFAKEIAMRYINVLDSTKQDLDKQNPIILALISVIPIAVLVILTGIMFYLILNDALPKIINFAQQVSATSLETAKLNAEVMHVLQQYLPAQAQNQTMQNITIQNPALPVK